jgi:hypothetical protein
VSDHYYRSERGEVAELLSHSIAGDAPDGFAVARRAWQRDVWASQGRTFRIQTLRLAMITWPQATDTELARRLRTAESAA